MTIPYERTLSVLRTRDLLLELAYAASTRNKRTLRDPARSLLKHYPDEYHLKVSARQAPDIWGDPESGFLGQWSFDSESDDAQQARLLLDYPQKLVVAFWKR